MFDGRSRKGLAGLLAALAVALLAWWAPHPRSATRPVIHVVGAPGPVTTEAALSSSSAPAASWTPAPSPAPAPAPPPPPPAPHHHPAHDAGCHRHPRHGHPHDGD